MTKVLLDTDKAAVIGAVSGATVTDAGTPASDDKVLIQDTSDSDNLKYVNVSDLPGGGVDVLSNVATDSIIGRTTAGSGDSEELTASATRTLLNVADGATADQDLSALAPIANPTFTGEIGIGSVNVSETELGILEGLTATTAELNILDGVTATTAELNILDGVTATASELNKMDGVTATTAELNYVDGVTSAIQTQLDTKAEDAADVGLGNVDNTSNATERAATATLENKRIEPRVSSSASGNITPTKVDFDRYIRTAQAAAITISNPTMDIGEVVAVQLTDNATARAITFGTHYMALDGLALPTTTTVSKVMSMVLEKVTATKVLVSYVNEA